MICTFATFCLSTFAQFMFAKPKKEAIHPNIWNIFRVNELVKIKAKVQKVPTNMLHIYL